MPRIASVQDAFLALVDAAFVQDVVEQSMPEISTTLRDTSGKIKPYIAISFGDIQQGRTRSAIGPRGDDYVLPVYVQCIAGTAAIARGLHNKLLDTVLGKDFPWSGNIRKRPGGGMFALNNSNNATEAYSFPASFGVPVQFE